MGYIIFHDRNWTWLKFPGKPREDVRARMKEKLGARWSRRKQAWYIRDQIVGRETLAQTVGDEALGLVEGRAPTKTWEYCVGLAQLDNQPKRVVSTNGNEKLAARFRQMADRMTDRIEHKRRPLTQNPTPRRMSQYNSRLHEANNMENVQKALRAMAEALDAGTLPACLQGIKTKKAIESLVRFRWNNTGGWGYESHGTTEFVDDSEAGRALQKMIAGSPEEQAEQERMLEIQQMETKAKLLIGQAPGFFPTPDHIARRMVDLAGIKPAHRVLEPSAGSGAIADVIREMHPDVTLEVVECNDTLAKLLDLKGHTLLSFDFLDIDPDNKMNGGGWDAIVMNPPFENLQDIDHVRHAYACLAEGGRLVSVMSESPFFRKDKKATDFRDWLEDVGYYYDLPAGAFQESGTGVKTRIVVIEK